MVKRKRKKTTIRNAPDYNSMWGYKDKPFQNYDQAEIMPNFSMNDGKGTSVVIDELKKIIKVGKTYKVKPKFLEKKQKAKLVAIYSDPIGFGNKGKNTDVRLKTEWVFQDPVGSYPKGKHETIEDINIEYSLRSKKRALVEKRLWRKHGMNKEKALKELKDLIKQKKLSRL